jgi:response regulator of citrate/malate metabolism
MMHKMLKNMNFFYNIYTSSDGNEAIEKISNNLLSINVIFLDKHMPNLDGITTAKKLRDLSYNNLIFGVTGDDNSTEITKFLHSGADNILIKPLNIFTIKMIIKFIKKYGVIRKKNSTITNINGELNWSSSVDNLVLA